MTSRSLPAASGPFSGAACNSGDGYRLDPTGQAPTSEGQEPRPVSVQSAHARSDLPATGTARQNLKRTAIPHIPWE